MLKAWLRPRQVGRRAAAPSSLCPQLGGKSSNGPPLSESHCSWWWWQSLSVSILRAISIHHSLVFWPPPSSPLSLSLTHSSNFSSLLFKPALSGSLCVKRLYLRGAVKQRKAGEWMGKIAPLISTKFDFSFTWWDVRCETPSLLLYSSLPLLCFDLLFFFSLHRFLFLSLSSFSLFPLLASQAVWHLAPSLWRRTVEADNYTSCPVSAL